MQRGRVEQNSHGEAETISRRNVMQEDDAEVSVRTITSAAGKRI
jgi:hypothetical protein